MCKLYEKDLVRIVEDRVDTIWLQRDGQTDGYTDGWTKWNQYTPHCYFKVTGNPAGWRLWRPCDLQLHNECVMNFEFWISQREEILLRKPWHLCGLALCLNENLDYVSHAIDTDATGSQGNGIITGRELHFLTPAIPVPSCVGLGTHIVPL